MFLSKIWFFLLAVFTALVAMLLVLQPRPMQAELDAQVEARLQGADRGTGMLIKIHARKWLDAAAQVSSDAQLYEALDQATRGTSNLELIHRTAQARLRYFNQEWKTDQLIAVDGKGKVLARTGLDEAVWKDDISGYPVVAEALRGYRLDDTWDVGDKVYRVTASPVIARDKYAGALLVVQEIGTDLAGRIHDTLGVDVAFLVRGQVAAQSTSLPILGELPALVKSHAAELAEKGHSTPISLKGGDRSYTVVAAPLSGEASAHEAAYVLIAERPLATSIGTTLGALSPSLMSSRDLAVLGGGLLGVLVIGFLLMTLEHDRPVRRLVRALQSLSRAEVARVDDTQHGGKFGAMARAVNATLDRSREGQGAAAGGRSIDSILGPAPGRAAPRAIDVAAPPPPPASPPLPASFSAAPHLPPLDPPAESLPLTTPFTPAAKLPQLESPAPPLLDRHEGPTRDLSPKARAALGNDPNPFGEPATVPHGRAYSSADAEADAFDSPPTSLDTNSLGALSLGSETDESTTVAPPSAIVASRNETIRTPTPGDVFAEAEYKAVFTEFLETKRRCGEPTDGVTFDKFILKLRQNREQLIARYACKSVKFQVYIKDGKAALKATPVSK